MEESGAPAVPRRRARPPPEEKRESLSHLIVRNCVTGVWQEPLHARSRTTDLVGHVDVAMVVPPIRSFLYCMLCPYLCYPISLLSLYGAYRCLRTFSLPSTYRKRRYTGQVMYAVQRRTYDQRQKRLQEAQVGDVQEIQHALKVVNGARKQFVDDPSRPNTAYYVVEQQVMAPEALFTGENWGWAVVSDSIRYVVPLSMYFLFRPSCKRLTVDLRLWWQGRLTWSQVRHPITNFFRTYSEYNRAMQRVNVTKPAPKGAQPWSRNL